MVVVALAIALVLGVALGMGIAQMMARDSDAGRRRPIVLKALSGGELELVTVGASNDGAAVAGAMYTTREARADLIARMGLGDGSLESCAAALDLALAPDPDLYLPTYIDSAVLYYRPGPLARRDIMLEYAGEALRRSGIHGWTRADAEALADEMAAPSPARATK
jgi:hypothetical protein